MAKRTGDVVVLGAGPAGLTAARELCRNGVHSVLLEADPERVGGISQTAVFHGHRFDIGGHRFFSKNAEIEAIWSELLGDDLLTVRRLSRIHYRGRLFDYPLRPLNALRNLGVLEALRCVLSYGRARVLPQHPVRSFEDWVVNRFGRRLFEIFFKTYTEKVWGMPCEHISADWAAQRIQDLSLLKALVNALGLGTGGAKSLIEEFRYPRLGPGMMWEQLADQLVSHGCQLFLNHRVEQIHWDERGVVKVNAQGREFLGDYFISSLALRDLIGLLTPQPPQEVVAAAQGLNYRDFLTVALVVRDEGVFADQWIYVHDPDVFVGRIQNYKNWSAEMVAEPSLTCLGFEYFCFVDDGLWRTPDSELLALAEAEGRHLGILRPGQVVEGTVLRVPKAYPVYDHGYREKVDIVRDFLATRLANFQTIGRNGMHRYNNQDHAMLTGILAARNLLSQGQWNLWQVNGDAEYLEEGRAGESRLVPERVGA